MEMIEFFDKVWKTSTERKFFQPILTDHILDESFTAVPFRKHEHYFSIDLTEMFLQHSRKGTKEYAPLSILVTKFIYAGQERSFPFFVGNQLLREIEDYFGRRTVEFSNIPVMGPVPYCGGGLTLFAGLFQVEVEDLTKRLLNFLGKIANVFEVAALAKYLQMAGPLLAGLSELMGGEEVRPLFGRMQKFGDHGPGFSSLKKGYLVYINCPEEDLDPRQLWVKDGQLLVGRDRDSAQHFKDADYLLLFINQRPDRPEYETLPSYTLWEEARDLLWKDAVEMAKFKYMESLQEVRSSPDLNRTDKNVLTINYKTNFDKEMEIYQQSAVRGIRGARTLYRGDTEKVPSPSTRLKDTAYIVGQAKFPGSVEDLILNISRNLYTVPGQKERGKDFRLTREVLSEQVKALKNIADFSKIESDDLCEAIIVAELGGGK